MRAVLAEVQRNARDPNRHDMRRALKQDPARRRHKFIHKRQPRKRRQPRHGRKFRNRAFVSAARCHRKRDLKDQPNGDFGARGGKFNQRQKIRFYLFDRLFCMLLTKFNPRAYRLYPDFDPAASKDHELAKDRPPRRSVRADVRLADAVYGAAAGIWTYLYGANRKKYERKRHRSKTKRHIERDVAKRRADACRAHPSRDLLPQAEGVCRN